MNKADLQEAVYKEITRDEEEPSISKNDTANIIDAVITVITKSLKDGHAIALRGFGTFEVTQTAARKARNPRSGEIVDVPAKKKAKFRPSGNLQAMMNS